MTAKIKERAATAKLVITSPGVSKYGFSGYGESSIKKSFNLVIPDSPCSLVVCSARTTRAIIPIGSLAAVKVTSVAASF